MGDNEALATKVDMIHSEVVAMKTSMEKLADAMVQIARLEVTQATHSQAIERVFEGLNKLNSRLEHHEMVSDNRIKGIEQTQPVQKLVSGWVLAWVAGVIGLVGGAVAVKILFP